MMNEARFYCAVSWQPGVLAIATPREALALEMTP